MAQAVIMPRQGQSVESCIITEWKKKEGDEVKEGDILFTYETDKASFDEEAKVSGTLLKILAHEDDDVPVLETVAVIGAPGENIDAVLAEAAQHDAEPEPTQAKSEATVPAPGAPAGAAPAASPERSASGADQAVSPRAKMLAKDQGISISGAAGTGPHGRVIERDVRALIAGSPSLAETAPAAQPEEAAASGAAARGAYKDVRLSNVRKTISKAMSASLATAAQLTINASFDAEDILEFRGRIKEVRGELGLGNITINDMVLFAVSRVLPEFPDLNAHFLDDHIRQFRNVHLGAAVDTQRGLLVPTIRDADLLSLNALSEQMKELAEKAQSGSISPDLLTGASFTVTNLGAFGIESFTPVINLPQVAILGVNTITTRIREEDGLAVPYSSMMLSLTFDHRAVDGAPAARFLRRLCEALENFTVLTAK